MKLKRIWLVSFLILISVLSTAEVYAYGPSDISVPSNATAIAYGTSGAGRSLTAYRFGSGKNVMVLGFGIHGYEDNFNQDGGALVWAAGQLMQQLSNNQDLIDSYDWSVYVLPCMNPDGLLDGYSHNGPGRHTTTYITSGGTLSTDSGVDLNRCFPYRWTRYAPGRNYNGAQPLAAKEAQALADFIQDVKGYGNNILIDTHGWTQQIITENKFNTLYQTLSGAFPQNTYANLTAGRGYFAAYGYSLGYNACLFEFPSNVYSMSGFQTSGYSAKYNSCILSLLKSYGTKVPPKPSVQVTVKSSCSGSASGGGAYPKGSTVTISANTGSAPFQGWYTANGALISSASEYTFTVQEPQTLIAMYEGDIFYDMTADSWYRGYARKAYQAGWITGTTPITFAGSSNMPRKQVISVLARVDGADVSQYPQSPFIDVSQGNFEGQAINWAYANGIVNGVDETHFEPDGTITREQMVAMLMRYLEYRKVELGSAALSFADTGAISDYARPYMEKALTIETQFEGETVPLVSGYPDGTLQPQHKLTRAEGVTFIVRMAGFLDTYEPVEAPDEALDDTPDEGPDEAPDDVGPVIVSDAMRKLMAAENAENYDAEVLNAYAAWIEQQNGFLERYDDAWSMETKDDGKISLFCSGVPNDNGKGSLAYIYYENGVVGYGPCGYYMDEDYVPDAVHDRVYAIDPMCEIVFWEIQDMFCTWIRQQPDFFDTYGGPEWEWTFENLENRQLSLTCMKKDAGGIQYQYVLYDINTGTISLGPSVHS